MVDRAVGADRVLPAGIARGPGAGNPQPIVVRGVGIGPAVRGRGAARVDVDASFDAIALAKNICWITGIAADDIHIHKMTSRRCIVNKHGGVAADRNRGSIDRVDGVAEKAVLNGFPCRRIYIVPFKTRDRLVPRAGRGVHGPEPAVGLVNRIGQPCVSCND